MTGFTSNLSPRLDELMARHVAGDDVGGVAWMALRHDEVVCGAAGVLTRGDPAPVERDSIFRIASMTKPVTAVAAMILLEECRLRLDDPIDEMIPELADRRVLVDPLGPIDGETVPAERPITVRDVLTFQLGLGMDFTAPWPQPLVSAMGELGLGDGPPAPGGPPRPDEWISRLGTLPLIDQPGGRWLYNVGSDVLGVLIGRASGQALDRFLDERIFGPLNMADTGFSTSATDRLGTCYSAGADDGERSVYDAPDGQWATPPAFPSGAAGLVSTVDDFAAFGSMLLASGRLPDGSRLIGRSSVEAMTTDQLGGAGAHSGISADGSIGWGFGVGVTVRRTGPVRTVGSYGWDGGLGTSWANDPTESLVGVVLTTDMFAGPDPAPAVVRDFWTTVYAGLDP